jgi:hypothetical protein
MKTNRKAPPEWRFTIEQIGRELRKVYPGRERLPPQLRALAKHLERNITRRRDRSNDQ